MSARVDFIRKVAEDPTVLRDPQGLLIAFMEAKASLPRNLSYIEFYFNDIDRKALRNLDDATAHNVVRELCAYLVDALESGKRVEDLSAGIFPFCALALHAAIADGKRVADLKSDDVICSYCSYGRRHGVCTEPGSTIRLISNPVVAPTVEWYIHILYSLMRPRIIVGDNDNDSAPTLEKAMVMTNSNDDKLLLVEIGVERVVSKGCLSYKVKNLKGIDYATAKSLLRGAEQPPLYITYDDGPPTLHIKGRGSVCVGDVFSKQEFEDVFLEAVHKANRHTERLYKEQDEWLSQAYRVYTHYLRVSNKNKEVITK